MVIFITTRYRLVSCLPIIFDVMKTCDEFCFFRSLQMDDLQFLPFNSLMCFVRLFELLIYWFIFHVQFCAIGIIFLNVVFLVSYYDLSRSFWVKDTELFYILYNNFPCNFWNPSWCVHVYNQFKLIKLSCFILIN